MAEQPAVRATLLALVGLSAAAGLKLVIWPMRPPLPQEPELAGLAALPLESLEPLELQPPRRQREISTGTHRRWRWPQGAAGSAGKALELELLPVRLRRYQQLELSAIQGLLGQPSGQKPKPRRLGRDGIMLSSQRGKPQLHTCWVAGQRGEVERERLKQLRQPPPEDAGQRLRITLGLEPPRSWECLLIRLSSPAGTENPSALQNAWQQLRPQLP